MSYTQDVIAAVAARNAHTLKPRQLLRFSHRKVPLLLRCPIEQPGDAVQSIR